MLRGACEEGPSPRDPRSNLEFSWSLKDLKTREGSHSDPPLANKRRPRVGKSKGGCESWLQACSNDPRREHGPVIRLDPVGVAVAQVELEQLALRGWLERVPEHYTWAAGDSSDSPGSRDIGPSIPREKARGFNWMFDDWS